jgi:hypothetical protein
LRIALDASGRFEVDVPDRSVLEVIGAAAYPRE